MAESKDKIEELEKEIEEKEIEKEIKQEEKKKELRRTPRERKLHQLVRFRARASKTYKVSRRMPTCGRGTLKNSYNFRQKQRKHSKRLRKR